jgi:RNA polymerase sigma factor (sigma-70 family)
MPDQTTSPLRGDERALYEQHAAQLIRHVRGAVNTTDAIVEDACATAWAILLRRQPARSDTLFAWLRIVAIREAIRMDRQSRALLSLERLAETALPEGPGTGDRHRPTLPTAARNQDALHARDALRAMADIPARPRRIFALHVAGYSYAEISQLTGDTVRTVDRQMRRAREIVRHSQP